MTKPSVFSLLLLLILFIVPSSSNVWDNIYSQTHAKVPIILSSSLNLPFKVPQYSLDATIDYNSQLQLITVTTYFDLLFTKMEVVKVEIDMKTLTVTTIRADRRGCQRYRLAAFKDVDINVGTVSKDTLFFVNILFKYAEYDQNKKMEKYQLSPFLFGTNDDRTQQVKKQLQKSIDKEDLDSLDDLDFDLDIPLFVYVNQNTGAVEKIYQGDPEVQVPFEIESSVSKPIGCQSEIKMLTNEEIKNFAQFIVKNRGNYDKFFDDINTLL